MSEPTTPAKRVVLRYEDRWDDLLGRLAADRAAGVVPTPVREALAGFFDAGSAVEVGSLVRRATSSYRGGDAPEEDGGDEVPADGLVAGWGLLSGALVFVVADDVGHLGEAAGWRGAAAAAKATRIRRHALEQGRPLVQILAAARTDPAMDPVDGPGAAFVRSGAGADLDVDHELVTHCLMITIVTAPLLDTAAFEATAAHLVVLAGADAAIAGRSGADALQCGLADAVVADLPAALRWVARAIDHLPPNRFDPAEPWPSSGPDVDRRPLGDGLAPDGTVPSLLDDTWQLELSPVGAVPVRTWLGGVGAQPVGLVRCDAGAVLDGAACRRIGRLVRCCAALRLPLVVEHAGLGRPQPATRDDIDAHHGLGAALAGLTVPLFELAWDGPGVAEAFGVRPVWSAGAPPSDPSTDPKHDAVLTRATVRQHLEAVVAAVPVVRPRPDATDRMRYRPRRTLQSS